MGPILTVNDLKTSFLTGAGTVQAVRGVSFTVDQGEILGIVGESGSGKSVTSMSILRLLPDTARIHPDSSVLFQGQELSKLSLKELREIRGQKIAMIFQDPMSSLNPLIPVGRQVEEMMRIHHKDLSRAQLRQRALELFQAVRIPEPEKRFDAYPHQFSGGMRQRVMIAMALSNRPDLLIADEPTTALDVTIQAQILELMKELQKKTHMGIIFITHNLGVVAEICDKVSVMYAGKMVEQGPVDDIFYQPAHPYTEGLLRSMPRVDAESYERLIPIEGTPVDMLNPPEGCPFAPRCEKAMKICLQKMPPYVEVGENHRSACWLRVQEQVNKQKEAGGHE